MRKRIDDCLVPYADPLAVTATTATPPATPMMGHMRNMVPLHDDIVEGLLAGKSNPTTTDCLSAAKRAHRIIELASEILLNRSINSEDIPSKVSAFIRSCKTRGSNTIDPAILEKGLFSQNQLTYVYQCETDGDAALVTHGKTSRKICDLELTAMRDPTLQVQSAQAQGRTIPGHTISHG